MKERVKMSTLPNGIRVVTQERVSGKVAFVFMVGCGSRYDPEKVVGVSHALEHMMFKGTKTRSAYDLARGMKNNGAGTNAMTGLERTAYFFDCPVSRFEKVVAIYADFLKNSVLGEEEWEKERGAILEERKMCEESNTNAVFKLLQEKMYNLKMGILGDEETIRNIKTHHMRDIIRKYYLPKNIVISVAGGIKHKRALDIIKRLFGNFQDSWSFNENLPFPPPIVRSKCQYAEKICQVEQTGMAIGFPGYSLGDNRRYALAALSNILGGGLSSRLFQEIREKRGLAYSIGSTERSFKDIGILYIYIYTTKPVEALGIMTSELNKIQTLMVAEEELGRAKFQLKSELTCQENSSSFALSNAQYLLFHGGVISESEYCAKIDAVTEDDIIEAARDILNLNKATVAITGPKSLKERIVK